MMDCGFLCLLSVVAGRSRGEVPVKGLLGKLIMGGCFEKAIRRIDVDHDAEMLRYARMRCDLVTVP